MCNLNSQLAEKIKAVKPKTRNEGGQRLVAKKKGVLKKMPADGISTTINNLIGRKMEGEIKMEHPKIYRQKPILETESEEYYKLFHGEAW